RKTSDRARPYITAGCYVAILLEELHPCQFFPLLPQIRLPFLTVDLRSVSLRPERSHPGSWTTTAPCCRRRYTRSIRYVYFHFATCWHHRRKPEMDRKEHDLRSSG